jgi:acetolactate synthase-1/3 small subunit
MKQEKFLLGMVVAHRPGVLHRVSNMFRRRNFNIESISVGATEDKELARMTVSITGDDRTAKQIVRQMEKLLDVVSVSLLDQNRTVMRELALVKLSASDPKTRSDIVNWANVFRSHIVDLSPESVIVEITGTPHKIDAFIELAKSVGIKEISRTGVTALERGTGVANSMEAL